MRRTVRDAPPPGLTGHATSADLGRHAPTVLSSVAIGAFLTGVERLGHDAAGLCTTWGIDRARPAIAVAQVRAFTDDCARVAKQPLFGALLGASLPRGAFGLPEFYWRSASTFRDALAALEATSDLVSELFRPQFGALGDRHRLNYPLPMGTPPIGRHGNEFIIVAAATLIKQLATAGTPVLRVGLAEPHHEHAATLEAMLGAPVLFHQPENWIELPGSILEAPVVSADPALFQALRSTFEAARDVARKPRSLVEQLAIAIEERLGDAQLGIAALARAVHMPPRTLQRRLQAAGITLTSLIDQVRRRRAGVLLATPALTLDEIAYELGFSELSAFVRAHRRWTSLTPGAARKQLLGA